MNSEIAKSRIGEVIRIDTVTSTQADFLATHVPVNNIHIRKKWDSKSDAQVMEVYDIVKEITDQKEDIEKILRSLFLPKLNLKEKPLAPRKNSPSVRNRGPRRGKKG